MTDNAELMKRLVRVIAENLPSPYALDDVWRWTSTGAEFNFEQANETSREEWEQLARAVLAEVTT